MSSTLATGQVVPTGTTFSDFGATLTAGDTATLTAAA
jgi:hypothetical protein